MGLVVSLCLIYAAKHRCAGCRKKSSKFVHQGILNTPSWRCVRCNKKPITKRVKAYKKFEKRVIKMRSIGVKHAETA